MITSLAGRPFGDPGFHPALDVDVCSHRIEDVQPGSPFFTAHGPPGAALALSHLRNLRKRWLAAQEELTVDGAKEAAHVRAQRARFESEMQAYGEAVGVEYRGLLKEQLQQAMRSEARLAAIDLRGRNRG